MKIIKSQRESRELANYYSAVLQQQIISCNFRLFLAHPSLHGEQTGWTQNNHNLHFLAGCCHLSPNSLYPHLQHLGELLLEPM